MKAYYVKNGDKEVCTRTINEAIGYLVNNLPEQIGADEILAKIGAKKITKEEFDNLPSFEEESKKLEELIKEMKLDNKES